MPGPRLHDDGATVEVDLHGLGVDEALGLSRAVIQETARRGRTSVRLVHGSSTSSALYRNRSIKHALYALLERGGFGQQVTGSVRGEDTLTLSLPLGSRPDAGRMQLRDVWR